MAALSGAGEVPPLVWRKTIPELESIRELEDRQKSAPRKALLGETKSDIQEKIDALLDETVDILSASEAADLRNRIQGLRQQSVEDRRKILELRESRVSAPQESGLGDSIEKIDRKIDALEVGSEQRDRQIAEVVAGRPPVQAGAHSRCRQHPEPRGRLALILLLDQFRRRSLRRACD